MASDLPFGCIVDLDVFEPLAHGGLMAQYGVMEVVKHWSGNGLSLDRYKPLHKLNLAPGNAIQWNLNQNAKCTMNKMVVGNVFYKMSFIIDGTLRQGIQRILLFCNRDIRI